MDESLQLVQRSRLKKLPYLDNIVENFLIFIDTCSLMDSFHKDGFLLKYLVPGIEKFNKNKVEKDKVGIYIIPAVVRELKGLLNNDIWSKKYKAKQALAIKDKLVKMGIAHVGRKDEGDTADREFINLFTKYSAKHKMCLITQDTNLAHDILTIGNRKSVRTKHIKVIGLDNDRSFPFTAPGKTKFRDQPYIIPNIIRPFKIKDKDGNPLHPIIESNALATTYSPCYGDDVFDNVGKKWKIKGQIASGGEGIIYQTAYNNVCKIYKSGLMNDLRFEKLKLMQRKQISISEVFWPKSIVFNNDKQPVGYLMEQVKNKDDEQITDMHRIFIRQLQNKYFPNLTRLDLVEICIRNLSKFNRLHKLNIIIGDINPSNILINKSINTFFIDTDSYQIEQYPCPVGQGHFTTPENQGKNYNEFLRTKEDERFAIATLLFMTLMPGKSPYSHTGGTTPLENIKKRNFSYPFTVEGEEYRDYNKQAPKGPWRFIWSHIPYYIKKAFYNTFKIGDYISVEEWIVLLNKYKKAILIGHSSNEIYPTEYKVVDDNIKNKYK